MRDGLGELGTGPAEADRAQLGAFALEPADGEADERGPLHEGGATDLLRYAQRSLDSFGFNIEYQVSATIGLLYRQRDFGGGTGAADDRETVEAWTKGRPTREPGPP